MSTEAQLPGNASASATAAALQRGRLRVYMGAAPGSGKTFAMLREAHARRAQGEDVVVGYVETHGRRLTQQAIGNLEVIPRLHVDYQGHTLEEMDLDAILTRRPQVVLVDELAHTNAPGVRHPKRYQDVEDILAAGIDVLTTLNVQHLESVTDLVEHITGIPVRETLPDSILDQADEIQFIDISPEALRKRMQHGNVYASDRVPTALSNFFRPGNLAALREIALRMVAQRVGAPLAVRAAAQDVLVAVSGRSGSAPLIRRAARLARRFDGICTVVTVLQDTSAEAEQGRERLRRVAELLGCSFIERTGRIADSVVAAARDLAVRHVVIGESERPTMRERLRRGLIDQLITELPHVDVHVIARHPGSQPAAAERPDSDELLRALQVSASRAGLRVYLGYAPGCGTTLAMLDEARRRQSRGTDVIVAAVSTQGRVECDAALGSLEVLGGRRSPANSGQVDVDALLKRNPEAACIDDLASLDTNGRPIVDSVPRLLRSGMVLIATLHLTDVRSVVEGMGPLLGSVASKRVIDDSALDLASELELVDVTPAVLDERLRRGEIVPPDQAAQARAGTFRPDVLAALRELAFRFIAEHTDRRLVAYMRQHGIDAPWEVRARVMLCIPPRHGVENVIQRTEEMVQRLDGRLMAVTVRDHERSEDERHIIGTYASLVHQSGGEFTTLDERDPATALANYARRILATHVVVTRGRGRRGTLRRLIRLLTDVDVHILAVDPATPA